MNYKSNSIQALIVIYFNILVGKGDYTKESNLVERGDYTKESKKTSYRTNSTTITNMNRCESNTVFNLYTANVKVVIENNNISSSENLTMTTKARPSLFYLTKRKNNSIVRKVASKTMAKHIDVSTNEQDSMLRMSVDNDNMEGKCELKTSKPNSKTKTILCLVIV